MRHYTLHEPSFAHTEAPTQPEVVEADAEFKDIYEQIGADPLLAEVPESEREETLRNTFELYVASKEVVAPVIAGFAHDLLTHADGKQIVFAGRDGIGPFIAASILKEKFDYPDAGRDQLIYAYLTRRIVDNTPVDTLQDYLKQEGLTDPTDRVILADIGMYGTIISKIQRALPQVEPRYLISKNYSIPGYADSDEHPMSSLQSVIGNPAVHFMEDTFSGNIPSPSELIDIDGVLTPNTADRSYPAAELLKRTYALKAIEDYTRGAEQPDLGAAAVDTLDDFLSDTSHFTHMMIPHTR